MHSLLRQVSGWMASVASLCLLVLMLITFTDVVGRYFFDAPLVFTVEIIELGMGLMICFGLALTTLKRRHISVDLITGVLPGTFQRGLVVFSALMAVIFIGLMTWRLWGKATKFWSDGLATQVLFLPVAPVVFVMAVACGVTTLFALYLLLRPSSASKEE